MPATQLDPRTIAETLGVTTLDLAEFLREKAERVMQTAARVAKNDPWYSHEDAERQYAELHALTERAQNLMQAAFACDQAYSEDNPSDDEEI